MKKNTSIFRNGLLILTAVLMASVLTVFIYQKFSMLAGLTNEKAQLRAIGQSGAATAGTAVLGTAAVADPSRQANAERIDQAVDQKTSGGSEETKAMGETSQTSNKPSDSAVTSEPSGEKAGTTGPKDQSGELKYVALSFDDGPHPNDSRILAALEKVQAKATFFMLGTNVDARPEMAAEIAQKGMELGNHSFSHANFIKLNAEQITAEVNQTNAIIEQKCGRGATLFRFPYGSYNQSVLPYVPMPIVHWSVDTLDWEKDKQAKDIEETIREYIHPGSVILMHSSYPRTAEALENLLPKLYEEGYRFVTVSELFAIYERPLEAHQVYRGPKIYE